MADVSETAALLLPILGCTWIIVQLVSWLLKASK